jgi:hypothetical protein
MRSPKIKLLLWPVLALILLTVAWPRPCRGYVLLPVLLEMYSAAQKNVAALNSKIKMVEETVNQISDEMEGVKPPDSDARTPNQQVRDLKESIAKELALLKADMPYLVDANRKLGLALDSYTKKQSPETLKNAEGLVLLINAYQQKINKHLDLVKSWCAEISKIRSKYDDEEWHKPDGKYKGEREALESLWDSLQDQPWVPAVVGMKAKEACDLILGAGLTPKIVALTVRPPEGKEYTVESQSPVAKTKVKPGEVVEIKIYRQVVPYVVGLKFAEAKEVLEQARLQVGGVVVEKSFNKKVSEEVFRQEPQAGELMPADRGVKLWYYDIYVPATPQQPPATRPQGFQKGDAGRIDPRYGGLPETISPDGNSIRVLKSISYGASGEGFGGGIIKYASRTEALETMKEFQKAFSNFHSRSDHSGEAILKERIFDPEEVMIWWTSRGFYGTPPPVLTEYHHSKIYRDVFIIWYTGHTYKFDDDLPVKEWPEIYKNSKKLIDERFPPKPLASSPGPEELPGGGAPVYSAGLD